MTGARRLALAQKIAAGIVAAFWVSFLGEYKELPAAIVDFEWNFVAPDLLWIVAPLLFASHLLVTGHRKARIACAIAGGALFYLGFLDVMYNLLHGQYWTPRGFLDAAVNLACLAFGAVNMRYGWGDE